MAALRAVNSICGSLVTRGGFEMRQQEREERVLQTLEDLREANEEAPIIVEGRSDRRVLRRLGIRGEIITLNSGSSVFHLCESLAHRYSEAIILTDWDRRGGQLCRLLREGLAANGVRCEVDFRARLTRLCKKEIKDVEGLGPYIARVLEPSKETPGRRFAF